MDEDCERIRLRKDVRDDVVGSERKSRRRKKRRRRLGSGS